MAVSVTGCWNKKQPNFYEVIETVTTASGKGEAFQMPKNHQIFGLLL